MRIRTTAVILGGLAFAVCGSTSRAGVSLAATYKATPENTANILSVASATLDESLTNLLRLEDLSPAPAGSGFNIKYPTDNTANVSWDLAGTGFELSAIYVFGGSQGANLYTVDPSQAISGSAMIHPPLTGNSGQFAGISHTLFLGTAVPEPSSVILACIGLTGFVVLGKRRPSQ